MGKNNIEKKSLLYNLFYFYLKPWQNLLFYNKVHVLNEHNIPKEGRLIFTPNHQNALMDALALLFNIKRQLVFVARADIFKKKFIARILYFLKILPVYRIRDGFDSLKNNEETFKKTADVLLEGNGLVILPEGNHSGSHSLRPLKKGFARIAFQTEEANDFKLNIQIVPVGVHYSNYYKVRENLIVNFGPPISIADYKDLFLENAPVALNKIREDLSQSISKVMLDIKSKKYYDIYETAGEIYNYENVKGIDKSEAKFLQKFHLDQVLVNKLYEFETNNADDFETLANEIKTYQKKLSKKNIKPWAFVPEKLGIGITLLKTLLNIVLLPVYLYSFILNFIPFQLSLASVRLIKDPQFKTSFVFVVSFLVFPIFYTLQTWLLYSFAEINLPWYLFVLSQIIALRIAIYVHKNYKRLCQNIRLIYLKIFNKAYYNNLAMARKNILNKLNDILIYD